jgi:hypothetical protein
VFLDMDPFKPFDQVRVIGICPVKKVSAFKIFKRPGPGQILEQQAIPAADNLSILPEAFGDIAFKRTGVSGGRDPGV